MDFRKGCNRCGAAIDRSRRSVRCQPGDILPPPRAVTLPVFRHDDRNGAATPILLEALLHECAQDDGHVAAAKLVYGEKIVGVHLIRSN
jgi:hypothetical protein